MNGRRSSPGIGLAAVVAGVIGLLTLPVITVAYARAPLGVLPYGMPSHMTRDV